MGIIIRIYHPLAEVMRNVSSVKREELSECWRKLHDDGLCDFKHYSGD
jgi:hypothetical protein